MKGTKIIFFISLQISQSELAKAETTQLRSHIVHLEEEMKKKDERIEDVTVALKALDKEHDQLRGDCDSKDEQLSELSKQLKEKVST